MSSCVRACALYAGSAGVLVGHPLDTIKVCHNGYTTDCPLKLACTEIECTFETVQDSLQTLNGQQMHSSRTTTPHAVLNVEHFT